MSTRANVIIAGDDRTRRAFSQVSSNLQRMKRQITSTFGALAGGAAVMQFGREVVRAGLSMERMNAALRTVFESQQAANREMQYLRETVKGLGLNLESASDGYVKLSASTKGTNLEGQQTREIFEATAMAARALGLSADDTSGILRAFSQVVSKGRVQAEELRGQIGERLPGAFQLAAKSMGVTTQELGKMMELGQVTAEDLLPKMAQAMKDQFSKGAAEAAKGAAANFERFKTVLFDVGVTLSNVVLPPLVALAKGVQMVINGLKWFFGPIVTRIQELGGVIKSVAESLGLVETEADKAAKAISNMTAAQIQNELNAVNTLIEEYSQKVKDLREQGAGDFSMTKFLNPFDTTDQELLSTERGLVSLAKRATEMMQRLEDLKNGANDTADELKNNTAPAVVTLEAAIFDAADHMRKWENQLMKSSNVSDLLVNKLAALDDLYREGAINSKTYADEMQRLERELLGTSNAVDDLTDAMGDYKKTLLDAQKEHDQLSSKLMTLDDLYVSGKINAAVYQDALESLGLAMEQVESETGKATEAIFDMDEALKTVQNNIQGGFSDLFNDLFSGKGVDSFKDFAKRVLDIFKRLLADMAAAWATSKIFNLPASFGLDLGGLFGRSGGSAGGAAANAVMSGSGLKGIGGKIISTVKGFFSSGSQTAGLFGGAATPASMVGASGSGSLAKLMGSNPLKGLSGAAGLAVPLGIAALGFAKMRSNDKKRVQARRRYDGRMDKVNIDVGETGATIKTLEDQAGKFFATFDYGMPQVLDQLHELGIITDIQNAKWKGMNEGLYEITGSAEDFNAAITGATQNGLVGFQALVGSFERGKQASDQIKLKLTGDFEAIRTAMETASAIGIGAFRDIEQTSTGATAVITGDIQRWKEFLEGFVRISMQEAISGVGSLEDGAKSATNAFLELAAAAAKVKTGESKSSSGAYKKYAAGGVSNEPAIFGESGPEAAVPLPDGRTIPVKIEGDVGSSGQEALLRKIYGEIRKQNTRIRALERA